MTSTRTDTHRPAVMDPADYIEVGYTDNHPENGGSWVDPEFSAVEPFQGHYVERGGCDHCGHHSLRYVVHYFHEPSGEIVNVGLDCANKLRLPSRERMQMKARAERNALDRKIARVEQENPEVVAFLRNFIEEAQQGKRRGNEFLSSIYHKLNRYGELSERQIEAVEQNMKRQAEWDAERAAEKASEPEPAPIPEHEGRMQITGKILSSKYKETQFGSVLKMLVLDDRGFKVWGSQPESLLVACDPESDDGFIETGDYPENTPEEYLIERFFDSYDENGMAVHTPYKAARCRPANRGDRVTFTAAVTVSDDDPTFGFFKRPTKAEVIS